MVVTHICDGGGRGRAACLLLLAAQRLAVEGEAAGVTQGGEGRLVDGGEQLVGRPATGSAQGRGEERERGKKEGGATGFLNVREGVSHLKT